MPSVTSLSRNVYLRFQSFYDEERLVCGLLSAFDYVVFCVVVMC